MLKKRISACLIIKSGIVVQSIEFNKFLPIGKPGIAIEFLNQWGIDEIIYLDIDASINSSPPNLKLIKESSKKCFVPLTIGGGISNLEQINELLKCGADKISLNQAAFNDSKLITKAAQIFGTQCIVVSIDVKYGKDSYHVYDYLNKRIVQLVPSEFAKKVEDLGAGEIFLNVVDRDGAYTGYDVELINSVCDVVKIPVICCGGAKNAYDMINVIKKTNASSICASNMFHFTENSVNTTKAMIKREIPEIRLETNANYYENVFDREGRIQMKQDKVLEDMRFIKIDREVI